MKRSKLKYLSFIAFAALALAGFAGCKNPSTDGAYKLPDSGGQKSYSVLFQLSNPSRPLGSGLSETTAYLRLVGVYFTVRTVESNTGSVTVLLDRCVEQTGNEQEPFGSTYTFRATLENKGSIKGVWYTPFKSDLSEYPNTDPSNLTLESYSYWQLSCTGGDLYLDEVAFVGEVLTERNGTGTGTYSLVPAVIHTATPQGGDSQARANQKAKILLDGQPESVTEIIK